MILRIVGIHHLTLRDPKANGLDQQQELLKVQLQSRLARVQQRSNVDEKTAWLEAAMDCCQVFNDVEGSIEKEASNDSVKGLVRVEMAIGLRKVAANSREAIGNGFDVRKRDGA